MALTSIREYIGVPRDLQANFNGKQLVYVSWDHHLLFAAPFLFCVPPQMSFKELVDGPLAALTQPYPDAASVDWADFAASLSENGIGHKDQIRFRTPGLNSLRAAA